MDGLSAAASVIAVIEISAKIVTICFQYSAAVNDAEKDIERLQQKLIDIKHILEKVKRLLDGPDKTRLSATQNLEHSLKECCGRLQELETQLKPRNTRKAMSRLGARALKWPFKSKEVENIVASLKEYEGTFSLSLQVDQTSLVSDLDQKFDLARLPVAGGASFDSHMEEHNGTCFENTRVEHQHQVMEWAKNRDGKQIFWPSGMAGTGKSTIARTVAQSFSDRGQLGASFFFKKGEGDRGNASKLLTTLAVDLMAHMPGLKPEIRKALDAEPAIAEKALKDQFIKLILQPLSEAKQISLQDKRFVVVIDALDECEREEDIRAILPLLEQAKDIKPVSPHVFVTSRPELPNRLGFKQMSDGTYQDLVLHEVPRTTIERDITLFLEYELAKIREQRCLDAPWPKEGHIQTLVNMAVPLFIFAATVCRFLGEANGNPRRRLNDILKYDAEDISKQDVTYLPIMNHLFSGHGDREKEKLSAEFRNIVGSIVVLETPLSILSLATLLDLPKEDIRCRLDSRHSVISIPTDERLPVRLLHLSFRDFLLDSQKRGKRPFWVDESEAHKKLAIRCLQLLSSSKGLKQNMCMLSSPGSPRNEIDKQLLDETLPAELRYACRYWAIHPQQSKWHICDDKQVHEFLQKYILYWLEAMSLIGETSETIKILGNLQSSVKPNKSTKFLALLQDVKRFVLWIRPIIEKAPLQLYTSAMIFAPQNCVMQRPFQNYLPQWISKLSKGRENWNSLLLTLEGHSDWVTAVAFSPDGKLVASASDDHTVRLWDTATGSCRSTLEGHSSSVTAVAFSPDSEYLDTDKGQIALPFPFFGSVLDPIKRISSVFVEGQWRPEQGQRDAVVGVRSRSDIAAISSHLIIINAKRESTALGLEDVLRTDPCNETIVKVCNGHRARGATNNIEDGCPNPKIRAAIYLPSLPHLHYLTHFYPPYLDIKVDEMTGVRRTSSDNETAAAPISPFMPMFEVFRSELDEHHDRRERAIKTSRDITALSKKMIFSLQRIQSLQACLSPEVAKENEPRQRQINELLISIAPDLQDINAWRYQRNISGGIQEYMEAVSFQHYLETQLLITYEECGRKLPIAIVLTEGDYILGLFDMVGELMRFAITTMAMTGVLPRGKPLNEETSQGRDILNDLRQLRTRFESLDTISMGKSSPLQSDIDKKMEVMKTCVEKVEGAMYGMIIRGRERPKGWMPGLGSEDRRMIESS